MAGKYLDGTSLIAIRDYVNNVTSGIGKLYIHTINSQFNVSATNWIKVSCSLPNASPEEINTYSLLTSALSDFVYNVTNNSGDYLPIISANNVSGLATAIGIAIDSSDSSKLVFILDDGTCQSVAGSSFYGITIRDTVISGSDGNVPDLGLSVYSGKLYVTYEE